MVAQGTDSTELFCRRTKSRLVEEVARGENIIIIIAKAEKGATQLVPLGDKRGPKRKLGLLAGKLKIPAGFDAALPAGVLDAFDLFLIAQAVNEPAALCTPNIQLAKDSELIHVSVPA